MYLLSKKIVYKLTNVFYPLSLAASVVVDRMINVQMHTSELNVITK